MNSIFANAPDTLVERLRKRAEIRRQITTRKSVQEGKPDRLADLLEESADVIEMRILQERLNDNPLDASANSRWKQLNDNCIRRREQQVP